MATKIANRRADRLAIIGGNDDSSLDIEATLNTDDIANLLGLTTRHVNVLVTKNVLIKNSENRFDTRAAILAFIGYKARAGNPELDAAKLKLVEANAQKVELQNSRITADLIPAAEVGRVWSGALRDIRSAILATPSRIASRLPHLTPHDTAEIAREISTTLADLADGEGVDHDKD